MWIKEIYRRLTGHTGERPKVDFLICCSDGWMDGWMDGEHGCIELIEYFPFDYLFVLIGLWVTE